MRKRYALQLELLNTEIIEMGEICELAIQAAVNSLLTGDVDTAIKAKKIARETDEKERTIEDLCLKMIIQQQPVASDLRLISSALKMITDMERIGDQAEDIATIVSKDNISQIAKDSPVDEMSKAVKIMVTESVNAFVSKDIEKAKMVIEMDDVVDDLFVKVRNSLIDRLDKNREEATPIIDVLMVAKYLERIADHAVNVAEWVEYSITGIHKGHNPF